MTLLIPHTSEWFQELLSRNSDQATHTAAIIKAARNEDVCGVCGDDPASDYQLVGVKPDITIRLCSDCTKGGENLSPLA